MLRHDHAGNCWEGWSVTHCAQCEPETCCRCHAHDEPRGACSRCSECPACEAARGHGL